MTTLYEHKVRCSVCGREAQYSGIGSTNAFGSPDLDTRPPEGERSTMFAWVQKCPNCGYCASDLSKVQPGAKDVVETPAYKKQLNNRHYPELANSLLCKAMVDEGTRYFVKATWAIIHAAWVCDDAGSFDQASECRRKAIEMLEKAEESGQDWAEQDGTSTAILVDLLRRSGQMTGSGFRPWNFHRE